MPLRMMRYLDLASSRSRCRSSSRRTCRCSAGPARRSAGRSSASVQSLIEQRARASDDPRTVAGLLTGSMIARGWIVAGSIFVVGLSEREAGLAAAILSITSLHLLLHRPDAHRARSRSDAGRRLSTQAKILIGVFIWLGVAILLYVALRQRRQERGVQAADEFKLDPWIEIQDRRHRPVDQQGGALPLPRLRAHHGHDDLHRQADAGPPEPRPDARRGRLRPHLHADRQGQHAERDRREVLPLRRHAVLLHLVLEHARLHPAAVHTPRDDRHLRHRLPGLRALRRHGEPVDPARAHPRRLDGYQIEGVRQHGLLGHLKGWLPPASAAPRPSRSSSSR